MVPGIGSIFYFLGTLEIFKKKKPLWLQGLFGGRVGECTEMLQTMELSYNQTYGINGTLGFTNVISLPVSVLGL